MTFKEIYLDGSFIERLWCNQCIFFFRKKVTRYCFQVVCEMNPNYQGLHHHQHLHKVLAGVPEVLEEDDNRHFYENTTGNSYLHRLVKSGDVGSVKRFLSSASKEEVISAVTSRNSQGSTPLHLASYYGRRDMVDLLVNQGAKPAFRNKEGWHAGHYACRWSQPTDLRLSLALRPASAASSSSQFAYRRIRDRMKRCSSESQAERKERLKSDSGIFLHSGSNESLGGSLKSLA